ncbi:unnamed protein product [Gongylonema pulchrum]|uniref:SH2 domain-containing protein n=1 Tax=Gongylonema pulchrum TaxID=637853 RepID=A0A183EQK0_9BILA|nr:unnamed protein product [Gongylonema pulchrum]
MLQLLDHIDKTFSQRTIVNGRSRHHGWRDSGPDAECRNKSFLESMKYVRQAPWYWGNLSWRETEELLLKQPPGTYLVRDSRNPYYVFAISYRTAGGVYHTRVSQFGCRYGLGGIPISHVFEGFSACEIDT